MSGIARTPAARFDATRYETFRFVGYELSRTGDLALRYALDDEIHFEERFAFPVGDPPVRSDALDAALWLLHLIAGTSYYKTAAPPRIAVETAPPSPPVARALERLYLHGLGEFAYRNGLDLRERIRFPEDATASIARVPAPRGPAPTLVAIGGGKDSVVSIEMLRRSQRPLALFSVRAPRAIRATAAAAGLRHVVVERRLAANIAELNAQGAYNGHVPITATVSAVAVVAALLLGFGAVALSNERSASEPNLVWNGLAVNHQYSKGLAFERDLRAALAAVGVPVDCFSALRPASELAIARAFARLPRYHGVVTSCNSAFRLDPARRGAGWCGDCPKCRFVSLILAPFLSPDEVTAIVGRNLLDDDAQYEGFALLAAVGGAKPFECVGEEAESTAAFRLLAADPRWRGARVVARFRDEVLAALPAHVGDPAAALAFGADHELPPDLLPLARATLGA